MPASVESLFFFFLIFMVSSVSSGLLPNSAYLPSFVLQVNEKATVYQFFKVALHLCDEVGLDLLIV